MVKWESLAKCRTSCRRNLLEHAVLMITEDFILDVEKEMAAQNIWLETNWKLACWILPYRLVCPSKHLLQKERHDKTSNTAWNCSTQGINIIKMYYFTDEIRNEKEIAIEKLHQVSTAVHITCWFSNFCDQDDPCGHLNASTNSSAEKGRVWKY